MPLSASPGQLVCEFATAPWHRLLLLLFSSGLECNKAIAASINVSGVIFSNSHSRSKPDNQLETFHATKVKGIGRWTVQMLLIFRLKRWDVLPVDDLGVRAGMWKLYGLEALSDRKTTESIRRHLQKRA